MCRTCGNERGFTLIEVLLALVLAALVMGAALTFFLTGIGANSRCLTQGSVLEEARRAVEAMTQEVKDSSESCTGWEIGVDPLPPDQYYDTEVTQVSFSRCIGYDTTLDLPEWGPVVTFGYEPAQGDEPGKIFRMSGGVKTYTCDSVANFYMKYLSGTGQIEVMVAVSRRDPESPDHMICAAHTALVSLRN